ncbi:monooxygenase [Salmonella enterica]|nr:monooxygenase [Salmonella enterica]
MKCKSVSNVSPRYIQIHFNFSGPFGEEMTQQLVGLAESINEEPGFIWKIWTESEKNQQAGGIYLFESEETAQAYIKKHTARLKNLGVDEVTFTLFGVNDALTKINHGNLCR